MNPDFQDILSSFLSAEVEFLLIGAFAMAAHGILRATGDIDLWVSTEPENASRILRALREFGAPMQDISEADFISGGTVLQIGIAPRRIYILTSIDGVDFSSAVVNRIYVEIGEMRIPVIGLNELIQKKLATGRTKDHADAVLLQGV